MQTTRRLGFLLMAISSVIVASSDCLAACGGRSCSAGKTACGGYRRPPVAVSANGGVVSAAQAFAMNQQLAAMQAAAKRAAALQKKAAADQKLLEIAQGAESKGDLQVAASLYQRLALRRPPHSASKAAQERLQAIQSVALAKLAAGETQLAQLNGSPNGALRAVDLDAAQVTQVFEQFDQIALEYAGVPSVDNKIADRINKLRREVRYARILNEPAAAELWEIGKELEQKGEACCAFVVYEQAGAFFPAPSAALAKSRLAKLSKDVAVEESVRLCRDLQVCHENYAKAQELQKISPKKAREYYVSIVETAPPDTSVHIAAREQLALIQ